MKVRASRSLLRGISTLAIASQLVACFEGDFSPQRIETPLQPALRSAVGCWRFDRGADHFRDRVPAGSLVFFDSVATPYGNPGIPVTSLPVAVVPLDPAEQRRTRNSGWAVDSSDVTLLRVWIGDGFTGSEFHLRRRADTLSGAVRGFADSGLDLFMYHSVRAVRVSCTASPARA